MVGTEPPTPMPAIMRRAAKVCTLGAAAEMTPNKAFKRRQPISVVLRPSRGESAISPAASGEGKDGWLPVATTRVAKTAALRLPRTKQAPN